MKAFVPGLLDRLMGESRSAAGGAMSIEQLKDSVARDLEALLNTRVAILPPRLADYPLARASILNYGLADFAGMCLTSGEDREAICAALKTAIETHEPRLTEISASLEAEGGAINRLNFVITARLVADPGAEPVNFNAVLQPSSLRYSISRKARHAGRAES